MKLTATFFSHFGAIRYRRLCAAAGWDARVTPVPRTLSSSCGTCVRYEWEGLRPETGGDLPAPARGLPYLPAGAVTDEIEQVACETADGRYEIWCRAEDS